MTGDGKNTFASLFDSEGHSGREVTKPDHLRATTKEQRQDRSSALLVDPASSAISNKRPRAVERAHSVQVDDLIEVTPKNALSSTMELSSREYQQIIRAASALRVEEFSLDGSDPFADVADSPDIADRGLRPTVECASWDERDDDVTVSNLEVPTDPSSVSEMTTQLQSPRPITLAGDDIPSAPADVTMDGVSGESFDDLFIAPESLDAFEREDDVAETRLDDFPLESQPPPLPDDASFDNAIRQAVDPFGFGGAPAPSLDDTGEWTAPDLVQARLPTRVSAPTDVDIERGRELYVAAIEELAMHRKTAALVHARLALGYDPDNHNYRNFCDDLVKMLGVAVDVSHSGTLPVMDADIVSWDGSSLG